jgi:hypothetical protein
LLFLVRPRLRSSTGTTVSSAVNEEVLSQSFSSRDLPYDGGDGLDG